MKELKPMLHDDAAEPMLRLLRTARLDGPADPEREQARVLAAALAVRPVVTPQPSRYGSWFVGGLGASLLVVGSWFMISAPATVGAPPRLVQATRAPASSEWSALPVQAAPVESLPVAPPTPSRREPSSTTAVPGDPLARIDQARHHVARTEPSLALDEVQRYRREFPGGAYRDEADALEIQALLQLGQRDRATTLGRTFLRDRPASPQAERIARLLGEKP